MMKIGLIADIHANIGALEQALEILSSHSADAILCAGDLVEKGAEGDLVVERLRALDIPCVMGNHDFDTVGNQAWLRDNADLSHPAMQGRLLKDETLAYLSDLPKQLVFTWEERCVLLTHGAPWSINEYIFPTSTPQLFQRIVREAQADFVVLGHTHMPMCITLEGKRIINPGAVCGNYPDGKGSCALLRLPEGIFEVYGLDGGLLAGYG